MTTLEDIDPLYHFSTHFPDRLSLLDSMTFTSKNMLDKKSPKSRTSRRKNNPRYKTQPITFDEIKEVEEPASTPNDENKNIVNSFLSKLQESGGGVGSDNRLQPNQKFDSVRSDLIATELGGGGIASNIWYDSPYPTKLSFLDVPETMSHHHNANKAQSERSKLKNRAARRRNNPRYKTQPITFDEIKEVEEPENTEQDKAGSASGSTVATPTNSLDILFNSKQAASDHQTLVSCGYAR